MSFMPYRVINIYYSVTCYTNHINSTRIQSIASMALMVFPDVHSTKQKGVKGSLADVAKETDSPLPIRLPKATLGQKMR